MFLQQILPQNLPMITSGTIQLPVQIQPSILPSEAVPVAVPYKLSTTDWLSQWYQNYEQPIEKREIPVTVTEYPQPGLQISPPPETVAAPSISPPVQAGVFSWLANVPSWAKYGALGIGIFLIMKRR